MFNFDFSTTTSFTQPPPKAGVYHVKLTGLDTYTTQSGNNRVSLHATVIDGDAQGCVIKDGINIPKGPDDKVKGVWMRFFSALGLSPAEIRATFSGNATTMEDIKKDLVDTIEGLTAYCYFAPAVEEGGWPTRKWLTPAQAQSSKRTSNGTASSDDALGDFINV